MPLITIVIQKFIVAMCTVLHITFLMKQITVEDFWLLLLEKSPHTTFEDLEDDLNAHEAEVDASLPELQQQLTALLA